LIFIEALLSISIIPPVESKPFNMHITILLVTLFTTLSIAAPSPLENALSSVYSKMSTQQQIVIATLLELTRRKDGGDATDSILQPVNSEDQVSGFVSSLARFLPSDASGLLGGIAAMGEAPAAADADAEVDGEVPSLSRILGGLGISV
jgi:hypothetical protein